MWTRFVRAAAFLAAVTVISAFAGGPARGTTPRPRTHAVAKLKQTQRRLLLDEALERLGRARGGGGRSEGRAERARDEGFAPGEEAARARVARMSQRLDGFRTLAGLAPNVIVNNRNTDVVTCPGPSGPVTCSTQSEQMIAAWHQYVLIAWNDGEKANDTIYPPPSNDVQGYGFSSDSGATWTDGGIPPKGNNWTWVSDPVVTVNEKTGKFYFVALADSTSGYSGIGIVPGTFSGNTFTWGTPVMIRKVQAIPTGHLLLDKPWAVADSSSDSLYVSYTIFTDFGPYGSDHIQFQRSPTGAAWTPYVTLSSAADSGYVQGSRPAVGPNGELYVVWAAAGPIDVDYFRIRKSTNAGGVFAGQVTFPNSPSPNPAPAQGYYGNWGTGAPGFNRERGVTYPSIAVDRSGGPNRGRVYVTWNESINFYDDIPPIFNGIGAKSEPAGEAGANDTPASATPFTVNNILRGAVGSSSDFDYWSFVANQAQTGAFMVDSLALGLDVSFRLFCSDGTTRLGLSNFGAGGGGLIVFTFPTTGTYYLRCAGFDFTTGGYRIITRFSTPGPERARDHRDVFVTTTNNGTNWTVPLRIDHDAGYFDDWLPEVAVTGQGRAFVAWYDWRDAPAGRCGGVSNVYISRSDDGGGSWTELKTLDNTRSVTDVSSDWTNSSSYLAPNQGDYINLYANENGVYTTWADVRNGDPDVYFSYLPLLVTPVQASLVSATAVPDRVTLTWYAVDAAALAANIYRRAAETDDWTAIGQLDVPASGQVVFEDHGVTPGARFQYRLGIVEHGSERFFGETWVDVPNYVLAIAGVAPNPAARDLWVSFTLPRAAPATLRLIDVAGREVRRREVGTVVGPQRLNLAEGSLLPAGIYAVKLTQGGRSVTARASVVR